MRRFVGFALVTLSLVSSVACSKKPKDKYEAHCVNSARLAGEKLNGEQLTTCGEGMKATEALAPKLWDCNAKCAENAKDKAAYEACADSCGSEPTKSTPQSRHIECLKSCGGGSADSACVRACVQKAGN